MLDDEILTAAEQVVTSLAERRRTVSTAESCTGGLLAGAITAVAGSSSVFNEGFVTYSNAAKHRLLGVSQERLDAHGAVSPQVAEAMAVGLYERTGASYAVAVTGIAGPGGGTTTKPVGLVYFGLASRTGSITFEQRFMEVDRAAVRRASLLFALRQLAQRILAEDAGQLPAEEARA